MRILDFRRRPGVAAAGESASRRTLTAGLDEPGAAEVAISGAKAAALARATAAGLPVLPGFVITTTAAAAVLDGEIPPALEAEIDRARVDLAHGRHLLDGDGELPLIVRSSSTVEDGATSSMAGLFTSVPDVLGSEAFWHALRVVVGSGRSVPGIEMTPVAVLVQPQLSAAIGGVLFGADPVTGRTDRLVVVAERGGPQRIVAGESVGEHLVLTRHGRVVEGDRTVLTSSQRRALADLARAVERTFGSPQDVEWAIDRNGKLHLLQSRPITTIPTARVSGPVLGPGPVAETFPEPLSRLEQDLWVDPLAGGVAEALVLAGVASRAQVERSPVVTTVGNRAVADLTLLGLDGHRGLSRLDPRPPARRLRAAWRVGRLRSALPLLAGDVIAGVDAQLLDVPDLSGLDDGQLMSVLRRSGVALRALHGYEVLAGLLLAPGHQRDTGSAAALDALVVGRAEGWSDEQVVYAEPSVLALVAPRVAATVTLPPLPRGFAARGRTPSPSPTGDPGLLREALRMRARWVQELSARAAWTLGVRLAESGRLGTAEDIRWCTLEEVEALVAGVEVRLSGLADRREQPCPSLPLAFRRAGDALVAVRGRSSVWAHRKDGPAGRAGGGGRTAGVVSHAGPTGLPPAGAILVVRNLDPGLATVLPQLGGLVSETGSVLSHLAILAREMGVPTVVGVPDALRRFPPGARVIVDGMTGEVTLDLTSRGDAS